MVGLIRTNANLSLSLAELCNSKCYHILYKRGHPQATCLKIFVLRFLVTLLVLQFCFTKDVGGPLLWEALGPGLLGLCLKMALTAS